MEIQPNTSGHKSLKDDPFAFDPSLKFTYSNAIFELGAAINELLGDQPGILASDMGIQNTLVSPIVNGYSTAWLNQLKADEQALDPNLHPGLSQQQIADDQAKMSEDNAASTASSTGLNGVMSMVSQGVSSKTTTYQNLAQQAQSVVTALLNFMSQIFVL